MAGMDHKHTLKHMCSMCHVTWFMAFMSCAITMRKLSTSAPSLLDPLLEGHLQRACFPYAHCCLLQSWFWSGLNGYRVTPEGVRFVFGALGLYPFWKCFQLFKKGPGLKPTHKRISLTMTLMRYVLAHFLEELGISTREFKQKTPVLLVLLDVSLFSLLFGEDVH